MVTSAVGCGGVVVGVVCRSLAVECALQVCYVRNAVVVTYGCVVVGVVYGSVGGVVVVVLGSVGGVMIVILGSVGGIVGVVKGCVCGIVVVVGGGFAVYEGF